jgi:hypothetical protein
MPQKNIDFLIKNGIEYKKHTPALIAKDDIVTSDLIFVMTNEQLELLTDKYAEFTDKIHLFLEFADNTKEDMPDPIGKTGKQFDKIATKIKEAVLKNSKKLNLTIKTVLPCKLKNLLNESVNKNENVFFTFRLCCIFNHRSNRSCNKKQFI